MKTIAVLIAVACSLFVGVGAQDVVFYEHAGHGGKSWTAPKQTHYSIPNGSWWNDDILSTSWWNDEMSSLKINSLHVKYIDLYEHREFKGDKLRVYNSTDYIGSGWNDKMSSFVIYFHPPPPGCLRAFRWPLFQGGYELFCEDRSSLWGTSWNDAFQSLVVAPEYVVTLYEHPAYQGRSTQVAGSNWGLANHLVYSPVGDEISSFRIWSWFPRSGCLRVYQLENFSGLTRQFCKSVEADVEGNLFLSYHKWPWPEVEPPTWTWYMNWYKNVRSAIIGPRCQIDLRYKGWVLEAGDAMSNHSGSYARLWDDLRVITFNSGDCGA